MYVSEKCTSPPLQSLTIFSIYLFFLQMKKLRAIVLAGGTNYENFHECLRTAQRPFEQACTDLRSQVAREACVTLAFLSQSLKIKFANFGEAVLLTLMNLIQNSAKVNIDFVI